MKTLIIGEKPSIAKKIVEGLEKKEKFKREDGYYESNKFIVSYCVGHLLVSKKPSEIDEKYKKWNFDNLPFYFDTIPLDISKSTKGQFITLRNLCERKDIQEIVNACDADREGELIFRNLINFIKPKCQNLTRMWIESVANPEIMLKQFEKRISETEYENLYESAKARAYADYFFRFKFNASNEHQI